MGSSGFGPLRWVSFPVPWPTSGSSSPNIVRTTTRPADCVEAARVVSGCVETVRVDSPEVLFVKVPPAYASGDFASPVDSPGDCFVTRSACPSIKSIAAPRSTCPLGDPTTQDSPDVLFPNTSATRMNFSDASSYASQSPLQQSPPFRSIHLLDFPRSLDSVTATPVRDALSYTSQSPLQQSPPSKSIQFLSVLDLTGGAAASAYQEDHIPKHTQPGTRSQAHVGWTTRSGSKTPIKERKGEVGG